jgi:hypothetical protein
MIRIAITQAAYDAIAATLPLGSVGYETQRTQNGKVFIWLERRAIDRLTAERRRGEDLQPHHHPAGRNRGVSPRPRGADFQLAKVVTLVNEQRRVFERHFNANFLDPPLVVATYPMIGSTLESMIAKMHKNGEPLGVTGAVPWYFTMEATLRPALYDRGVLVWRQLQRGMPHVPAFVASLGTEGNVIDLTGYDQFPSGFRP